MNRWIEYGMYVSNEGRRFWRGEREGQKREDFFCLYEGNWLGTKIDCIAVLFMCVGFLFGKLIFFNYTRFCLFVFSSYFLFFCFFSSHSSIHVVYSSGYTVMGTIYYLLYLPLRTEITDAMTSLFTNNNISHVTFLPIISTSTRQLVSSSALRFHHLQKF